VWLGRRQPADSIAENLSTDPSFENWTSATNPTSWSQSSLASINQEVETTTPKNYMVLEGGNSARVVTGDNAAGSVSQTITPSVATEGVEVNVSAWVYATTSALFKAVINAVTTGTAHGGTGWELLTLSTNLGTTDTSFTAGVRAEAAGGTARVFYIDEVIVTVGQTEAYDVGWEPLLNWHWIPPVAGASNGGTLEFPYLLGEKRRLRIVGMDLLSAVSSDTGTFEIDGDQLLPLYDLTRQYAAREMALNGPVAERSMWRNIAGTFGNRIPEHLINGHYVKSPRSKLTIPDWGR